MKFNIHRFGTVESTNLLARKYAEGGAGEGTVITAEKQEAGRGRKGDYWYSGKGGLWFTVILRPNVEPEKSLLLPLLTGISVFKAMKKFRIGTKIKLPNDIMARNKKLCGILCENSVQKEKLKFVLVGVGINVFNKPPDMGISVKQLTEKEVNIEHIFTETLTKFSQEYQEFLSKEYFFA